MTNEEAHRLAREKGVSPLLYALVRLIVTPIARIWFRLAVAGSEQVPPSGAAIVAPNHKSFWDAFFIALATRRQLRFMGKTELFGGWWGRLLVRLGAFPVRRGESDADALETARIILRQGGLLALFPEGTRVRDPETLGSPRRGAARLALESGAPLIPCAIAGTERLFAGPFPRPVRVRVAFSAPVGVEELQATPEAAAELIDRRVWPQVEQEFERLRAPRRTVIAAAVAALGLSGLALRRRRRAAGRARRQRSR